MGGTTASALARIDAWPAAHAAAGVVDRSGPVALHGLRGHEFRLASVTKLLTACAVLVAAEEGILELDEPAGPAGSTVRHLLAHASSLPFDGHEPIGRPAERRIYSNTGYELLGELVASRAEMAFARYLHDAVLAPAGMLSAELRGSPAADVYATLDDVLAFAEELVRGPSFLAPETFDEMTRNAFGRLSGVVPGIGRQESCDWGLGFELRDDKLPHWTGSRNSPRTFGHFGGAGTFLWVDPDPGIALACLTDLEFGPWALEAWPALSDAVLESMSG